MLDCWLPRERTPPAEWVKENIFFSAKEAAVAGYWSDTRFPYSREPLECFNDPSIETIVLKWGTQLGKTTILGALVAWVRDNDPSPLMVVSADEKDAKKNWKTKFEPMLERCEATAATLPPKRLRSVDEIDLGEMFMYFAWSGSKSTLSGASIRYLLCNERNLWSVAASREGSPLRMALDRTKAFPNRKILLEGKPTVEGACEISSDYEASDQRTYHVPCPLCGTYQELVFGDEHSDAGLKWERDPDGSSNPLRARETAYYQCGSCRGRITEPYKLLMLRRGVWVRKGESVSQDGEIVGQPERPGRVAGFYLNSMYSTLLTWGEFAESFLEAHAGTLLDLQAWWNGWMALAFRLPGRRVGASEIEEHAEFHGPGVIPVNPAGIICTVDVQEHSLWYVVRAWGYGGSSWMIRYGQCLDFDALDQILSDSYETPVGPRRVDRVLIDSGYRANDVYEYCVLRQPWAIPIKGEKQYGQPAMTRLSKVPDKGIPLLLIDAGQAFDQLYDRRIRIKPGDPGYWSLHSETGNDYYRSLAAWQRQEETDKYGRKKLVWVSKDKEWEHLADCEKIQEAAAYHFQFALRKPPRERKEADGKEERGADGGRNSGGRRDGRGWWER